MPPRSRARRGDRGRPGPVLPMAGGSGEARAAAASTASAAPAASLPAFLGLGFTGGWCDRSLGTALGRGGHRLGGTTAPAPPAGTAVGSTFRVAGLAPLRGGTVTPGARPAPALLGLRHKLERAQPPASGP